MYNSLLADLGNQQTRIQSLLRFLTSFLLRQNK